MAKNIRAIVTIEKAQVTTNYVKSEAVTSYERAEAIATRSDFSINQWYYEDTGVVLSDLFVTLINKNVAESVELSDEIPILAFGKNPSETLSLVESFARVVTYNRNFTDAFTLDDLSQIDKYYYGNKGNIFAFTDILGLTYEKNLTDNYTVGDFVAAAVNKAAQDSFSLTDTPYNTFSKVVNDAFTLDDSALIDKDFYGNKGNVLGVDDIFVRAVDYKRRFPGSLPLGSNLLNSNSLDASSTPDTRVIVEDKATVLSQKNFNEILGFSDYSNRTITKVIIDAFTLDDSALINKDFVGNKGNVFSFADVLASAVHKTTSDSFGFSDSKYFSYSKNSSDPVFFAETDYKNIEKALPDSFSFSDVHGVQLTKSVSDAFALDDSALIDKDYFGNKGNVVGLSDLIDINLIMSNQLGTRALNTMPFN